MSISVIKKAFLLFVVFAFSCDNDTVIEEINYNKLNEFCIVRTRKQLLNNEKREELSVINDTIDFTDPEYFLLIAFERECYEGRLKNIEKDKQSYYEISKKNWAEKVKRNSRLLDSLVSYRDTIFFRENCHPLAWNKNNYSDKDFEFGWPYTQTDLKSSQQIKFLQDLNSGKLKDTITFEYYFADYWKREKNKIEARMTKDIDPSDIGPRVRCSGRVRIISYSSKGGTSEKYTSCSAYTSSKSGRCSYH